MMKYWLSVFFMVAMVRVTFCLEVDMNVYAFYTDKSYAELHFRVQESSLSFHEDAGVKKVGVEFIVEVYDRLNNLSYGDKFVLNGVKSGDGKDFLAVQRFFLLPGLYRVHVTARDLFSENNSQEFEKQLSVFEDFDGQHGLSDPFIMAKLQPWQPGMDVGMSRQGYYLEPLPYTFADTMNEAVVLYQEVYLTGADSTDTYYLNYTISDEYKENLEAKVLISQYKKLRPGSFQFVVIPISLKELPSGQYHLSTYLVNREKKRFSERKMNFYKSNPAADLALLDLERSSSGLTFLNAIPDEELDYILKAHVPITPNNQLPTLQTLIRSQSNQKKRKYIEQFWNKRSTQAPGDSFNKYMEVARAVDKEFYSNVGYGFQTHRGHIFLKHGKPSSVLSIDSEPDAPPYEIWYYNKIPTTNQTNVRFLFWNESLSHNDFWLLHSTCYGERNNPTWEMQLYKSIPEEKIGNTVDCTEIKKGWNRQARTYFNQF